MRAVIDYLALTAKRVRGLETQYTSKQYPVDTWSEWLPAKRWAISSGAPVFGYWRRGNTYYFDNGVTGRISTFWRLGREISSSSEIYFVPYISARSATSGYFYCQVTVSFVNDNELVTAAGSGSTDIRQIPVWGTVNWLSIYRFPNSFSGSGKEMICIDFERQGGHGSDTATGIMDFYGMEVFLPNTLL